MVLTQVGRFPITATPPLYQTHTLEKTPFVKNENITAGLQHLLPHHELKK